MGLTQRPQAPRSSTLVLATAAGSDYTAQKPLKLFFSPPCLFALLGVCLGECLV